MGSLSAIDVSICSPSLHCVLDFDWDVHADLCGSHHYPTFIDENHRLDARTTTECNTDVFVCINVPTAIDSEPATPTIRPLKPTRNGFVGYTADKPKTAPSISTSPSFMPSTKSLTFSV